MTRSPRDPGESIPAGIPVYRGLRASSWRDADTGEVRPVAFLRRQVEPHVSVSESASNAVRYLRRHYGVAELMPERVRRVAIEPGTPLGLDVVADPILTEDYYDPQHPGSPACRPGHRPERGRSRRLSRQRSLC
jgi:hypothetical protein